MFAIGMTVGLAEGIIDDKWLVQFIFIILTSQETRRRELDEFCALKVHK